LADELFPEDKPSHYFGFILTKEELEEVRRHARELDIFMEGLKPIVIEDDDDEDIINSELVDDEAGEWNEPEFEEEIDNEGPDYDDFYYNKDEYNEAQYNENDFEASLDLDELNSTEEEDDFVDFIQEPMEKFSLYDKENDCKKDIIIID
jgi:hypothetical protein